MFVGSSVHILYDIKIGNNVIIGTGATVAKDIPDNSVVVGAPARVIGTFDDYVKKYMNEKQYPDELKPTEQKVSDELAKYMWEKFDQEHKKG